MYKNDPVPGSPFQFAVGEVGTGGANKVTAHGSGLERGHVNVPAEFSISTREAGAGGLSIAVEGPSKAEINFEDRKDGSCGVSYVVTEPGTEVQPFLELIECFKAITRYASSSTKTTLLAHHSQSPSKTAHNLNQMHPKSEHRVAV